MSISRQTHEKNWAPRNPGTLYLHPRFAWAKLSAMKRFLKALFWWDNPKAGIFFGILLVMLVATVVLPVSLYCCFAAPADSLIGTIFQPHWTSYLRFFWWVIGLTAAYVVILSVLYSIRLYQFTFNASTTSAALIGSLYCFVMIPVCAVKQRNWRAFALALANIAISVVMWAAIRQGIRIPFLMCELVNLATLAMSLAVVYSVAYKTTVSRWLAVSPLLVSAATLLASHTHIWRLENRVEREKAQLIKSAGITMTFDDVIAVHTNGVPITEEPYAILYSQTNAFSYGDTSGRGFGYGYGAGWIITEDEETNFNDFCATAAAQIALMDELTLRRDYRPGYASRNLSDIQSPPGFALFLDWTRFYAARIALTQGVDPMPQIVTDIQRMNNIIHWVESKPTLLCGLNTLYLHGLRTETLCRVLSRLPDDLLLAMQSECLERLPELDTQFRQMMRWDALSNMRMLEEFAKLINGLPNMVSDVRKPSSRNRIHIAWILYERLHYQRAMREFFERLDAPLPTGKTRLDYLLECDHDDEEMRRCRLPFSFAALFFSGNYALHLGAREQQTLLVTAIAVERYRRRHAALPESLDMLVPEFLDAVPVSVYDNAPLAYEHGLMEVPAPYSMWDDDSDIEPPPYTFNGFRISGSYYADRHGDEKTSRQTALVPLGKEGKSRNE